MKLLRALPILVLGLTAACSGADDGDDGSEDDLRKKRGIQLVVTVDWEGSDLKDENLRAMEGFHQKFPDVKLVQFL
ncbi:MAG: hypothetical protein HOO96_37000, partial [Polyangiaceae bacterium]|nr:hypothetical protein [Polyangiaceae bacterium]